MLDDKTLEKWKVMLDTVEGEDNPMDSHARTSHRTTKRTAL
jgi:hypothetical protein